MATLSLVADVGGTNTRVALAQGTAPRAGSVARFANDDFDSLDALLQSYCAHHDAAPDAVCVAWAGPVTAGREAHLTNRGWSTDLPRLSAATGAPMAAILNDLQAQGHALAALPETGLQPIRAGRPVPGAARLVIGIGTGFNIAPVHGGTPPLVPAAEAGHALLPLRGAEDLPLAAWLARDHGIAAVEDLLSGRGLEAAYAFHAAAAGAPARPGRAILAGLDHDPVARRAVRSFCEALGTVAGDLALIHLPVGGIALAGGMAQAMAPHLMHHGFEDAFTAKGRFGPFMDRFAVSLITDDTAALIGCAAYLQGCLSA